MPGERSLNETALAGVRAAIVRVDPRISPSSVLPETSLVDDLGFDSLRFTDVVIAIEDELGIREFPFQEWYDVEFEQPSDRRFTVASLVATGVRCMRGDGG